MNLQTKIIELFKYKFRIQLKKHNFFNSEMQQLVKILREYQIPVVFDVGANIGQFASELRKEGYDGKIVSFEPLSEAHSILKKEADSDNNWIVAPRCAVGDSNGRIDINISGNLASSSILDIKDRHIEAAPGTNYVGKESVTIHDIDSILGSYVTEEENCFIKIDTQGFEEQVINGSIKSLSKIAGFYMELSLVELYSNELLMYDMFKKMKSLHFNLIGIWPSFINPNSGHTYQVNATFLKEDIDL